MPCMCCSARPATNPTMPRVRSPARSTSMPSAQSFRDTWREKGIALGSTRIGVNAGPAIVGNFGGGRFFDYTAYGDTINIAARLETANKQLGTRICVSQNVARQVPDFRGRPVGDLVLRGRTEPLRAFEPLSLEQYDSPSTQAYLTAFGKIEAADPSALGAFAAAVGQMRRPTGSRVSTSTTAQRRDRHAHRDGLRKGRRIVSWCKLRLRKRVTFGLVGRISVEDVLQRRDSRHKVRGGVSINRPKPGEIPIT